MTVRPILSLLATLAAALAACAAPSHAPARAARQGILVLAHGGDEDWNRAVEQAAEPLRRRQPVAIAFGMARASTIEAAIRELEAAGVEEIAAVQLFVSGESFRDAFATILGLGPKPPAARPEGSGAEVRDGGPPEGDPHGGGAAESAHGDHDGSHGDGSGGPGGHGEPRRVVSSRARIRLAPEGIGESPLADRILADRVAALSVDPPRESVLVLAHGPGGEDANHRWLAAMNERVQALRSRGAFRDIRCETLREDWPEARARAEARIRRFVEEHAAAGGRVLVVPFRVAGFGPYAEVLRGLDYVADGRGFCPHPNVTRWIEAQARACWKDVAGDP